MPTSTVSRSEGRVGGDRVSSLPDVEQARAAHAWPLAHVPEMMLCCTVLSILRDSLLVLVGQTQSGPNSLHVAHHSGYRAQQTIR